MIGPQAWENLFQTVRSPMYVHEVHHEGKVYYYSYDWEVLEMFEGMTSFKKYCIEDIEERQGEYADRIETVYKSTVKQEPMESE